MHLQAFLDELTKIATQPPSPSRPIPVNAVGPKGPSIPKPGGLAMPKLAHEPKAKPEDLVAKVKEKIEPSKKTAALKPGALKNVAKHLAKHEDLHEVAGLATLALPNLDSLQARARAAKGEESSKKRLLSGGAHDALEVGGLGYLAAPIIAKKVLGKRGH